MLGMSTHAQVLGLRRVHPRLEPRGCRDGVDTPRDPAERHLERRLREGTAISTSRAGAGLRHAAQSTTQNRSLKARTTETAPESIFLSQIRVPRGPVKQQRRGLFAKKLSMNRLEANGGRSSCDACVTEGRAELPLRLAFLAAQQRRPTAKNATAQDGPVGEVGLNPIGRQLMLGPCFAVARCDSAPNPWSSVWP